MITEKELKKLKTFGKEGERTYSDRWKFAIIGIGDNWDILVLLNELNGRMTFIKYLSDMDDFRNVYKAITNKKLK